MFVYGSNILKCYTEVTHIFASSILCFSDVLVFVYVFCDC